MSPENLFLTKIIPDYVTYIFDPKHNKSNVEVMEILHMKFHC